MQVIPLVVCPLLQCQNGHLFCANCSGCCPPSSEFFCCIQNKALQSVMQSVLVNCKYAKQGCTHQSKFNAWKSHERECSFRTLRCPISRCDAIGYQNLVHDHWKAAHEVDLIVDVCEQHDASEPTLCLSNSCPTPYVLLKHKNSGDLHLLHQDYYSERDADVLRITSLDKSCKRKYELIVQVEDFYKGPVQSYVHTSVSMYDDSHNHGRTPGLILRPRPLLTKRCSISMGRRQGFEMRIRQRQGDSEGHDARSLLRLHCDGTSAWLCRRCK